MGDVALVLDGTVDDTHDGCGSNGDSTQPWCSDGGANKCSCVGTDAAVFSTATTITLGDGSARGSCGVSKLCMTNGKCCTSGDTACGVYNL